MAVRVGPAGRRRGSPNRVLTVDVGGSKVKVLVSGQAEPRRAVTGPRFTPDGLIESVHALAKGWRYDAMSLGIPCPVRGGLPIGEPPHLGPGWVGVDFSTAFDQPVRVVNDASMQALGSYEGGSMLFLGLGTGMGSALVLDGQLQPLELGRLPYGRRRSYEDIIGARGLERLGKKRWREAVAEAVARLAAAFVVDDIVIGGGNAKKLDEMPPGTRRGSNAAAFQGGYRLWE